MRLDYYQKYSEREWHDDYTKPLECPFVKVPYTCTLSEKLDNRWIILNTKYVTGLICFDAVILKPDRWMTMDKEEESLPTDNFTGYTYNSEGPFGYRCKDIDAARERIYNLSENLRPVNLDTPIEVIPSPVVVVPVPVIAESKYRLPKKKKISDMTKQERRAHDRRMRLIRFADRATGPNL